MGRSKKPARLLALEGKSHLSNEELDRRLEEELNVDLTDIVPPKEMSGKMRQEFMAIAAMLAHVDERLFTELDVDELARYVTAKNNYWAFSKLINNELAKSMKQGAEPDIDEIAKLTRSQNTFFVQCETTAKALGLNVTGRCNIIFPKGTEKPKENKFDRFNKR